MCKDTKSSPLLYHSLLIPLLKVSNFLMKYFSLSYLYSSSLFLVCSSMETDKSARLWPGRLLHTVHSGGVRGGRSVAVAVGLGHTY